MAKLVTKPVEKKNGTWEWLENRKWILPSFFSIIIFVMAIWGIGNFNQLLLYDDEFGYWAASAYLTGTDWTSVTSGIPYYSYGYGFLILTPIRLIFSNTETMYQAAIVVNALLLVGSYWIARNVTKQLFEKAHWALIDAVCFVVMLYPSNIVFSHIAWAECLLVFLFWVFVWLSLRVLERPTLINHIGIAVLIVGLYAVHQRTLAIIISTCMIMLYSFVKQKESRKPILAFLCVLFGLLIVHYFIKNDILNTFYNNNVKVAINDFGGQSAKLASIFTTDGFLKLVFSVIGKWFYLVVSTGMFIWWSASYLFSYIKEWIDSKRKVKIKKGKSVSENRVEETKIQTWHIWMTLLFVGNFMITAIYMINVSRNDILVYGRYNEYLLGLFCIMGIYKFLSDENWFKKCVVYIGIGLAMAWICQNILDSLGLTSYQAYHSIMTLRFLKTGELPAGDLYGFAVVGVSFAGIIMLLLKAGSWKKLEWIKRGVIIVLPICLFATISYSWIAGRMTEKQILRVTNIRTIVNWIERLNEPADIYYLSDTESRYWSESFQFLLGERPLEVTTKSNMNSEEDAYYIVGDGFVDSTGFEDNYYCIKRTNQFALVVPINGEIAQKAIEMKN